jgi:hypothetical protein
MATPFARYCLIMSAIKNCTVLVWNSMVDSYHVDAESAKQRAATIVCQWRMHVDCGSDYPKPRLEVMTAADFFRKQFANSF